MCVSGVIFCVLLIIILCCDYIVCVLFMRGWCVIHVVSSYIYMVSQSLVWLCLLLVRISMLFKMFICLWMASSIIVNGVLFFLFWTLCLTSAVWFDHMLVYGFVCVLCACVGFCVLFWFFWLFVCLTWSVSYSKYMVVSVFFYVLLWTYDLWMVCILSLFVVWLSAFAVVWLPTVFVVVFSSVR